MPINIDGSKGIRQNTTEVTKIPVGTTAQRPANPEVGMMRFNTDQGSVEWYDELTDVWVPIGQSPEIIASGGTVTDIEQDGRLFRVHTFTSDGTFEVTRGGVVEYLIVAGGGGGGGGNGGSAGAGGGFVDGRTTLLAQAYSAVIGSGGAPGTGIGDDSETSGSNSTALGLTAIGGGRGASQRRNGSGNFANGADGGSGGGGAGDGGSGGSTGLWSLGGEALQPSSETGGHGFNGGRGFFETSRDAGGGGGGASSAGENGASNVGGNGGNGRSSTITGTSTTYAGGGGGGSHSGPASSGGLGGGGAGGTGDGVNGQSGTNGLGGGGGGGDAGGNGGSGIVIVRYRIR